jgi:hypothetical protein
MPCLVREMCIDDQGDELHAVMGQKFVNMNICFCFNPLRAGVLLVRNQTKSPME